MKLHFWKCFKTKKRKNSGKIEPVYPATTFLKIYIDISLCMGYPAGELFVLAKGGSSASLSSFMPFINSFRAQEHLKVQKFMDQHNFEMIHFECTIPAIGCTIPVLLCYADSWFDFGI